MRLTEIANFSTSCRCACSCRSVSRKSRTPLCRYTLTIDHLCHRPTERPLGAEPPRVDLQVHALRPLVYACPRDMLAGVPDVDGVPNPVQEGRDLLDYFYGFSRADDPDRYLLQDEFRQDVYRIIVFQLQLAIEELVRSFVFEKLTIPPDPDTFTHKENVQFVKDLEALPVLDLAARLHILSTLGYKELVKLNTIRNKCAHHWQLHSFSVRQMIRAEETTEEIVPEIPFNGRNLLTPEVMKEEFLPLYGGLYVELWAIRSGVDHPHLYTDETLEAVEPEDEGGHGG